MLSKSLGNSLSYGIFYKFWKKARVYYTLSISRGGAGPRAPLDSPLDTDRIVLIRAIPSGSWVKLCNLVIKNEAFDLSNVALFCCKSASMC